MHQQSLDTALLVFIRSPHQEIRYKRLLPQASKHTNQQLFQQLNRHAVRIAEDTQLPTYILDSPQQQGYSFGERLANAFQTLYARGFQRVIAIGNDCLSLTSEQLIEISRALQQHPIVLGPSYDGGVYAIGIDRKAFNFQAFCQIPWQTQDVQQALGGYAKIHCQANIVWWSKGLDVDHPGTFRQVYQSGAFHQALALSLTKLLGRAYIFYPQNSRRPAIRGTVSLPLRRGPPSRFTLIQGA